MDHKYLLLLRNKRLALRLYLLKPKASRIKSQFSLKSFNDEDLKTLFRFERSQLKLLRQKFKIPWKITCKNGTTCSGLEGLCIVLRRLAYPCRLFDLKYIFHRPPAEICIIFNTVLNLIAVKFEHLLSSLEQPWLTVPNLIQFSNSIYAKGAPLKKCWGFIDGTVRPMCRPTKYQKECYNGHKRVHALKYQSVIAPNGLIANIFGPIEGRRHDSFMLSESRLLQKLEHININQEEPFCLYGDPAYPLRPELQAPYKGSRLTEEQALFNKKMSSVRISVEWGFGKVLQLFSFMDFKKNQKLYLQPLSKYFKVAVLFTNAHTCLNGSATSTFFNIEPPSIHEYLR